MATSTSPQPRTRKIRWFRLLTLLVVNSAIGLAIAWAVLWMSGHFVTINENGGDQSQSSPVDTSPGPVVESLPWIEAERVRNVVFIIGDGMGFSHVTAARSELTKLNEKLLMERFPATGWQTTHSLESVYTDSASSASSLATGFKVPYRAVSQAADGTALQTIMEAARDRGMAVGVVTDSYLLDATPAAFLTHTETRRDFEEIARQMAFSEAQFLAGENLESWSPEGGKDPHELRLMLDTFRGQGFEIARSAEELTAVQPSTSTQLLALLPPGEIADADRPPRLAELADLALRTLSLDPEGYFLMVESEEPDSGGHNRNLRRVVRGIESINAVAALAVERAIADRETLVLITADHETGGMSILHGDADHTLGIRWSTISHTAEPVPIYAFGAGAERFSGVKDNTEIPRTLADLLGLGMFD